MKAVAAFLLVLCCLAVSQAWQCSEGPRLYNAVQVDAGAGKVVARDRSNYMYYLIGSSWYRMSTITFRHATVGPAGIWASGTTSRVYKYIAGQFRLASGLSMYQMDAGGDGSIVGVSTSSYRVYCLRSTYARAFYGVGTLNWTYLARVLRYYSCSPTGVCWGVDTSSNVYVTRSFYASTCGSGSWLQVPGLKMKMVEVAANGNVFAVGLNGLLYQRAGISSVLRQGTAWSQIPMCSTVIHASYDLRNLWAVTSSGIIMKCTH